MNCDLTDFSDLTLIGAGGFAYIYGLKNGNVVKAIISKDACEDAFLEMNKQAKVYNAWNNLMNTFTEDPIINRTKTWVKIPKPIASCNKELIVDDKNFSCYFLMEKLSGMTLSTLQGLNPNVINDLKPDFKPNDLMLQLSLNSELPEKIYGVNYSKKLVGYNNPPRGYFINDTSNTLQKLGIDTVQMKEIMGFVYGYLFYAANLVPIDIEFALGRYAGKYYLNVLDFGMTVDLDNMNNNTPMPRTYQFLQTVNKDEHKTVHLEKLIIEDISTDLYCDLEDDISCRRGWDTAKVRFG